MKTNLLFLSLLVSTTLSLFGQRSPLRHLSHTAQPSASLRSDDFQFRLDSIVSFQWKEIFAYDSQENPIRYIRYAYSFISQQFEPYLQNEMQLDNEGKTKTLLASYWDNANKHWNKNYKEENFYGANGTLDSIFVYSWDGANWVLTQKRVSAYNNRGQEKSSITYTAKNNTWTPSARAQTAFDSLERPHISFFDVWSDSSKSWKGDIHSTSYYDVKGDEVEFISAFWNYQAHRWDTSYKETHTHDLYILNAETQLPSLVNWMRNSRHRLRSTTIYSRPGPWVENGMYDLYYSPTSKPVVTGLQEASATLDGFSIYPNPVVDVLQVKNLPTSAQASLLDANGNKVLAVSSDRTDVSHLPAGVYLFRVEDQGEQTVKKVVKR